MGDQKQQGGGQQAAEQKPKPNIRLRKSMPPVTEDDLGYRGIKLPTADEQKAGWHTEHAQTIVSLYGSHYELLNAQG